MSKILSKILVILCISILLLNMAANSIFAAIEVNINKAYIEKIGEAKYHLKYYREDGKEYRYLTCDIVGFYDDKGNFNPAYCMDRDLKGAGEKSYYVKVDNLLKNNKVWRVIKNGYPYKSAKELGLSSKYDAFVVTKHAVYCMLGEAKLDYYKAEKDDKEAVAMLKALKKLVNIGKNGTETQQDNPLSLEKVGSLKEDGEYFSQEYKLNSKSDFNTYEVSKTKAIPSGGFVADTTGKKMKKFKAGKNFKVMIPKSKLTQDLSIDITAQADCKAYVILEGKTTVTKTQNYVVTAGEYSTATTDTTLKIQANTAKIVINKTAENTKKPLQGVKFSLYKDDKVIAQKTTDKTGIAKFENLYPGKYKIVETETNSKYILDNEPINIDLSYNETKNLNISNKVKTGNLKIIKQDKDDENIKLEGVEFEIYDEEKNLVGTHKTDEKGEIYLENLPIGKYKIKETETNKWYNLDNESKTIEIKQFETSEITIKNELKKGQIKVIKVDSENKEVKLRGVKFEVQDKDGKVLEILETDKNGEATTSKYAIRDYENLYLKETQTNEKYVLNDKITKIKLEENQITNMTFKNEKIKGKIKIVKTSKDDNKLNGKKAGSPLAGVKFEIYNSKNVLVQTVTTNKNGVAISSDLEKGKYKIKEVETNKYYFLNQQEFSATINSNKEVVELNITNESQNPDIDIEKSGPDKAEVGKQIEYDISIRNTGNTALDNFTMTDNLPYKYVNFTKFKTGTYNQDVRYNVYYKTNLSKDYVLLMEDLNSKENYEINFEQELADNETLTEIKLEFGTVDVGFSSNENPHITGVVKDTVKSQDVFTNIANVSGDFEGHKVKDVSKWKTVAYKLLPQTGM